MSFNQVIFVQNKEDMAYMTEELQEEYDKWGVKIN